MPLKYEDTLDIELDDLPSPLSSIPLEWDGKEAVLVFSKDSGQRRRISGYLEVAADGSSVKVTKAGGKFRVLYPNQLCKYRLV